MKKRIFAIMILFITIINIYNLSFAETASHIDSLSTQVVDNNTINTVEKPEFDINSEEAVLIDAKTGNVLAQKNMDKQAYPASTTKILTAIIAIEKLNLNDIITASNSAVMAIPVGYSNAGIKAGEKFDVKNLLQMFLIHSANEVGYIFAEKISGNVDEFSKLMNQKASELGCKNTHFTNPSGIHDSDHYSTAYDMALIAKYCMQNETFRSIVSQVNYKYPATDLYPQERNFKNTNDLIDPSNKYYYKYAIGIKTGYTSQAKNCLISGAQKDGIELITVVLGADKTANGLLGKYVKYEDTINLFNYGFNNYQLKDFQVANTTIKELVVKNATKDTKNLNLVTKDSLSALLPSNFDINNLKYTIELNEEISAPINQGDVLGKLIYSIDGIDYSTDLIASSDVIKSDLLKIVFQIFLAILVLIILSLVISSRNKYKNKKRKNSYKDNNIYKFKI